MCNHNIKSIEIQNLIHLYMEYQHNIVSIEDVKMFFEKSRINIYILLNLCDKIEEFDKKYLHRCEIFLNKSIPFIYHNNERITIHNCKLIAMKYYNLNKDIYTIKEKIENLYNNLCNFITEAHKKHNYNLLVKKNYCLHCNKKLLLKNDIKFFIEIKKKLDNDEAYCFNCESIFKMIETQDSIKNITLDSKNPNIIKIYVDKIKK